MGWEEEGLYRVLTALQLDVWQVVLAIQQSEEPMSTEKRQVELTRKQLCTTLQGKSGGPYVHGDSVATAQVCSGAKRRTRRRLNLQS